jgi:hypothetical protein
MDDVYNPVEDRFVRTRLRIGGDADPGHPVWNYPETLDP